MNAHRHHITAAPAAALALTAALALAAATARAATNNVSGGGDKLQKAIAFADPGDVLLVAAGTYSPIISYNKTLTIIGVSGAAKTIIDGKKAQRCASLGTADTHTNTVLDGFTLKNGDADSGSGGGALAGTLKNCVLTGCAANFGGGAARSTLNNCTLSGNSASKGGGAYGGTLNNCTLSKNVATAQPGGGASEATLNNCLLTGNSAPSSGGTDVCTMNNCTVVANKSTSGGCGGVFGGTLRNCLVWGNEAASYPETANYSGSTAFPITFVNSCSTPPKDGLITIPGNGTPRFVDFAKGNFRLAFGSVCIDAGNDTYAPGTTDLDGNPRKWGAKVDIGAYEYSPPLALFNLQSGTFAPNPTPVSSYTGSLPAGATGSMDTTLGKPYGPLPTPTRTGHVFQGWFTAATGGTQVTAATKVTSSYAHFLYAQWKPAVYTVTFNPNGGIAGIASKTVAYGQPYGPLPAPVHPEGRLFNGWRLGSTSGSAVTATTTFTQTTNVTLWATWNTKPVAPAPYLKTALGSGSVTTTSTYDGFVRFNMNGISNSNVFGTVTITVTATTKNGATTWKASAKVTDWNNGTASLSATPTSFTPMTLTSAKGTHTLTVTLGADTFSGTITGPAPASYTYPVAGARSPAFADKNDTSTAKTKINAAKGLYNVLLGPEGYLTLTVADKGAVKFASRLSDGTALSGSTKLLYGMGTGTAADWLCAPVYAPIVKRHLLLSALLWLDKGGEGGVIRMDSKNNWTGLLIAPPKTVVGGASFTAFGGWFGDGKNAPATPPAWTKFYAGVPDGLPPPVTPGLNGGRWVAEAFPWGLDITPKLTLSKATAPVKGAVVYDYASANPSGATLTYTPKTGLFKGAFKLYYDGTDAKGLQHKTATVSYTGVCVPTRDTAYNTLYDYGFGITAINKQPIPIPVYLQK